MQLAPDDDPSMHRHYLERRSLSRAMRLFLLEREMHDLGKDWIFKSYSARDDEVYEEFMKEIDDFRIKVKYLPSINLKWNFKSVSL